MSFKDEEEITEEIVRDVTEGVGSTGVRAGIIGEVGISNIFAQPNEGKSFRASAVAQKEAGAPLSIHLPFVKGHCERVIEILEEEGADLKRTIMCHAEFYLDDSMDYTFMLADAGLYIQYDTWGFEWEAPGNGIVYPSDRQRANGIKKLIDHGNLEQVLLSQDVCMKVQSSAFGGNGRAHMLRDCPPLFADAGISEVEI